MAGKLKVFVLANNAGEKGGTNRVMMDVIWRLHTVCDISLLTLQGHTSAYPYPETVRLRGLGPVHTRVRSRLARTLHALRTIPRLAALIKAERPQTVISFLARANITNLLTKRFSSSPYSCVICERNYNSLQYGGSLLGKGFKLLMRATYGRADAVVANARELATDLQRSFGVHPQKLKVIYNPFDLQQIARLAAEEVEVPWFTDHTPVFINVARLIPQKNHQLLLSAFARVRHTSACRLVLLGEGPLQAPLQATARRLGIENDVLFLGWQDNPFKYMRRATAFVLTSNYEGFPSVLVEAMASGCPVISTACPSGPREILQEGACGLLVPVGDENALVEAMRTILGQEGLRAQLAQTGKTRIREFDTDRIAQHYKAVICG